MWLNWLEPKLYGNQSRLNVPLKQCNRTISAEFECMDDCYLLKNAGLYTTIYRGIIEKLNLNHGDMCTEWDWGVVETFRGKQIHLLHGKFTLIARVCLRE